MTIEDLEEMMKGKCDSKNEWAPIHCKDLRELLADIKKRLKKKKS
jgi:hypothetical protein